MEDKRIDILMKRFSNADGDSKSVYGYKVIHNYFLEEGYWYIKTDNRVLRANRAKLILDYNKNKNYLIIRDSTINEDIKIDITRIEGVEYEPEPRMWRMLK